MKITVTLVVDVDPKTYHDVYGDAESVAKLRTKVRKHVMHDVRFSAAAQEGAFKSVELKGDS